MKRTPTPRPKGDYIIRQRGRLLHRDGPHCNWCQALFTTELPATLDHLLPLCIGGPTTDDNAVLACDPCNTRRSHYVRCTRCDGRIRQPQGVLIVNRHDFFHAQCVPAAATLAA